MTAPLRSTPRPSAVPGSQNMAPVAEFRCLFTHDFRRKQKRWQDGYLKFHTFNNRVMVYDQARNFLGDTYYKDSNELHEGDELNLDKGVMVEVAEAMGVTQTDLTPLFEKQTRESPARPKAPSQTRPFQKPSLLAPSIVSRTASQLRHKSLNTLLGASKGPIGKAVPMQSPYEARKEKENELVEESATKRQKTVHNTASWRASSPIQEETPAVKKDLPLWARTTDAKNARKPTKFVPPAADIIVLDSEPDLTSAILSDVTLPSTPPGIVKSKSKPPLIAKSIVKPAVSEKPLVQTPKIPRGKVPVPNVKALETPKQPAPASSPPVSASNRLTNIEFAVQPVKKPQKEQSLLPSPPRNPKAKSLRLSTGVKRGTLFCQSLPQQVPRAGSEPRASGALAKARKTSRLPSNGLSPPSSHNNDSHSRERSASLRTKPPKGKRKGPIADADAASKRVRISKSSPKASLEDLEDPEVIHGIMDQQLLVPSSPAKLQEATSSPAFDDPNPGPAVAGKIAATKQIIRKCSALSSERETVESRSPSPESITRKALPQKQVVERSQAAPKLSLPPAPLFEPPLPPSRETSPARTEASDTRSRTSSTSPGKVALSTGGFCKKPKRTSKQPAATTLMPETSASAPHNETVALPPHLLRAGRKGPLISTTELAALLQKPKKTKKAVYDPIEDEMQAIGKSPNRSFRRVRSENDAPIPSAAEDWEKRSLSKNSSNLTEIVDEPAIAVTATGTVPPKKKNTGLSALIKKTDPRRRFQRTQSLSIETNIPPVEDVEIASPVVDKDVGPWSTEAFDLFDWRPPNRD